MAQVSRYAESWAVLKRDRKLTLSITPGLQHRLIKALRERKTLDRLYQFQTAESQVRENILYTLSENKRIMYIRLVKVSYSVADL